MTTIDFIKASLEMSKGWILGIASDMQDSPMTFPTPNGGNHPLWAMGHLTYSEADLTSGLIKGEANPGSVIGKRFSARGRNLLAMPIVIRPTKKFSQSLKRLVPIRWHFLIR